MQTPSLIVKKTGRNDSCPCGSGMKSKRCCGALGNVQAQRTCSAGTSTSKAIQVALEHHKAGRLPQAEIIYRQILEAEPSHQDALHFLGVIAYQTGNNEVAVELFRKAIGANPTSSIYCNLGAALRDQGKLDAAVECYHKALAIDPDNAEACNNLGNTLNVQGKLGAAVECYHKALAIKPDFAEAYSNLGNALKDQCRLAASIASYRKALAIKPDFAEAHSNYLMTSLYSPDYSPADLIAAHLAFAERFEAPLRVSWPSHDRNRDSTRRLRVGFVSADFREHPVGFFLESIAAHLDRRALDIVFYQNHSQVDALTKRLQAMGFTWKSLVGHSDEYGARRISEDAIDILIDLSGHTGHNRMRLFARKPAPVQATWLGYPATTGLQAMDYILCDRYVAPANESDQFVEKPWYLPDTYLCFTAPRDEVSVSALPALGNGQVTFGCFNNLPKMNDAVVALWARVLHAAPDSRLFLKTRQFDDPSVQRMTLARFVRHGIGADRLILKGATSRAEHLAAYHRVDMALDPFPYNGTTTSVEGLWMGVPLITKRGDRFVARQGASILRNAGVPEWIAADDEAYVAIAAARAADLSGLAALREQIRARLLASPLCNAPRFAQNLEAAFREMWQAYCFQEHKTARIVPPAQALANWRSTVPVPKSMEIPRPGPGGNLRLSAQGGWQRVDSASP